MAVSAAFVRILLFLLSFAIGQSKGLLLRPGNNNNSLSPSYDYVIVGGGLTGLVVANRLSEDPDVTVLVLEAGELAAPTNEITVPGLVGHGWNPTHVWNLTTTPQEYLDNQARPYPVGHVVGGGTIINGLVMTRGAEADYDAWEKLGNEGWGWRDILPYFIKSERFTLDLDNQTLQDLHINPDMSTHGTNGPLEVTYPAFFYNQSGNFLRGAAEMGLPLLDDPNSGIAAGAMIVPASISSRNRSREDARTAYMSDDVISRPNLHVATGSTVTRLLLDDQGSGEGIPVPVFGHLKRAYGVEFTTSSTGQTSTVNSTKEVILAAGAILSPALLQASGIGPAELLNNLDIPIQVNLPGVGQNLQDHGMVSAFYNYTRPGLFSTNNLTDEDYLQHVEDEYFTNHTGPWTSPMISTTAFPSLQSLFSNNNNTGNLNMNMNWSSLLEGVSSSPVEEHLPANLHPTIIKGYTKQRALLLKLLARSDIAALEIMADSIGTLSLSTQHTFSRGSIQINTANPFAAVINDSDSESPPSESESPIGQNIQINPRYCSHPIDCDILLAGLLFNERLMNTPSMKELSPNPIFPWNSSSGEALARAISTTLKTEFHTSGTTSMMPLDLGGVVNNRLVVHGTSNLRVVDGGIIPLIPAAHLQAGLYAVAEKAADLIKQDRVCTSSPHTSTTNNTNGSSSSPHVHPNPKMSCPPPSPTDVPSPR